MRNFSKGEKIPYISNGYCFDCPTYVEMHKLQNLFGMGSSNFWEWLLNLFALHTSYACKQSNIALYRWHVQPAHFAFEHFRALIDDDDACNDCIKFTFASIMTSNVAQFTTNVAPRIIGARFVVVERLRLV